MRALVLCLALALGAAVVPAAALARSKPSPAAVERAALRKQLAAARKLQIERLRAYREAGVFPRQQSSSFAMVSVLIDDRGRLCAVAQLMAASGLLEQVKAAAAENNFIKFADVTEGPFMQWILGSGLTQEEVAMIQRPYRKDPGDDPGFEARERERLQQELLAVEQRLVAETEKSLDVAVERALARR